MTSEGFGNGPELLLAATQGDDKLRLPKTLRRLLKRTGKLKLRLAAKVKDPPATPAA